ncbi:hypothetical protein GM658_04890 [Pseudoduganella eburnea]|uniref:Uncharacterized protein n=1 Tax=Massilia eburnea TaxID=1776165 RepID=A0A6L6QCP6_9BURK|nr:hypothetical protein [Massilia eburnea]MTW09929.1 hypothetical protein [Massilia eburnea]
MRARHAKSPYRDELELNALCIDFVHGGLYAWTYLSRAGVADADILRILNAPADAWCYRVENAETTARLALNAAGIRLRGWHPGGC